MAAYPDHSGRVSRERRPIPAPLADSPAQVAGLLNISTRTVYALLESGELPSIKIGSLRRIPREAVLAFIARQLAAVEDR